MYSTRQIYLEGYTASCRLTTHDSKINKVAKLLTDLVFLFFVVVVERKSKGSRQLRMKLQEGGRQREWLKDNTKKDCRESVEYWDRMDVLEFSQSSSTEQ